MGCVAHGCAEVFYLMDTDIPKDSNTTLTIMNRSIDICAEQLDKKNMTLPENFIFHATWPVKLIWGCCQEIMPKGGWAKMLFFHKVSLVFVVNAFNFLEF